MTKVKTAVLISGRGSNLQALIGAGGRPRASAEIGLVISNEPKAPGLEFAEAAGISTAIIDHRAFSRREEFEQALDSALRAAGIGIVCLAGFMRILSPWLIERWHNRMLNIHPSLLPAFPGLHTHQRALAAGVKVHGCTVHVVRPAVDDGPIIVQGIVPVHADDDPSSLAARVLRAEHRCYPLALELLATGQVEIDGMRVRTRNAQPQLVSYLG